MKTWIKETAAEEVGKQMPEEMRAAADTDKSGSVSWDELKVWLSGGGLLALVAWYLRKKQVGDTLAVTERIKSKTGDLYKAIAEAGKNA